MKTCAEAERRKADAKSLLVHYFERALGRAMWGPDQQREVESIVDLIFDAAVIQAREERREFVGA